MNIPSKLLLCKKCKRLNPRSSLSRYSSGESPYFLVCSCPGCNETWFLCPLHNRRWTTRNQYAAVRHFKDATLSHPSLLINTNNNINENLSNDEPFETNEFEYDEYQPNASEINKYSYMSQNSQQYFALLDTKPNQVPAQYLVHAAFAQHTALSSQFCNTFETEFHLQATRLCLSTTNLQHQHIVSMFYMLQSCINLSENNKFVSTRLPSTMADINKYYMIRSTSIRKSLPHPKPTEFDNHVVVNLKDVISHMFAYGTLMNGIYPYANHEFMGTYVQAEYEQSVYTPFVQTIIDNVLHKYPPTGNVKPLILLATVWSDGFDANNVVHNAPSIWLRTITISPPPKMSTSVCHSFVLHMSREGVCHDNIDALFNQELQELEDGVWFYSPKIKKSIFVILKVQVYAADRPERSKLTHVLGHTGLTTKRWLYSAYLPSSKMQSCNACFQFRVKVTKINPSFLNASHRRCGRCADWNFDHPAMKVPLPDNYPTSCNIDSPSPHEQRQVERINYLQPMILSFDNLLANAKFIYYNVYKRSFNITNAKAYGRAVGLSSECIKNTCIAQAKTLREMNPNYTHEEILNKFEFPHIWQSPIKLHQFIDAPMHLIFQGIVKSVIEMISEWLIALSTKPSYYKNFCEIIHPLMHSISNMNLSWCFLNTFNLTKNFKPTGWIANNYLAFARLMLVFYRYIRYILPAQEAGLLECEGMIQSGLCLISYIMSRHNNDPKPIMEYTKLFLSCVDKFETKVYVITSIQPIWRSRGNFLSLLNLPLQQEYFGNVRNFWEGERERYIQHIKPLLSNLRHSTSFLLTKVERLYQLNALDYVIRTIPNSMSAQINTSVHERNSDFIIYKDIATVNDLIRNKTPISGIELSRPNNTDVSLFCFVVKAINSSVVCHKFEFDENFGYKRCAHFYQRMNTLNEDNIGERYDSKQELLKNIRHFILLIPNLKDEEHNEYTIVSNEWTYLNEDMTLQFSTIQFNLFSEL